eukprot:CAMPEP_0184872966 /NCGR_PEP_ID=MMETSP0580-20130426/41581_1 /TAXON_ID=1118495 /ORGANISM="Dactyliosolen fragilissimus" /LENGTH=245 /DNA_ID=CAMNT_0027375823 /DNA_START=59 /DNA_END=796 /DNA_ORIENTATION=+
MSESQEGDDNRSSIAPDAMDQSIYQMIMSQESPTSIGGQISGLYSPKVAAHPIVFPKLEQDDALGISSSSKSKINTGIPPQLKYMPYPIPWRASAGPEELPPDFGWLTDSCAGKAAVGIFGGAFCGLLMGVFMGAMSDMSPPVQIIDGKEVPQAPLKEQMRTTLRATGEKCLYWSRNFAFITGVFGGSECLVEKYRGTHDVWNSVISGCVTGAAMQAKQGPQAAALGCGGFAAFSLVIDKIMGTH